MLDFYWKAVYDDGSSLNRIDSLGNESKYVDIDRNRLKEFHLYDVGGKLVLCLHLKTGQKLIYRERVTKNLMTGEEKRTYLAGWQENRNGVNVQCLCFVFPDGHVEVLDKFREDHVLYGNVVFLPEEELKEEKIEVNVNVS